MRTTPHSRDAECEAPPWLTTVVEVVAHELGNHLTALSFMSEVLLDQPGVEGGRDAENVRTLVSQAASLVRTLTWVAAGATPPVGLDARDAATELQPLLHRLVAGDLRVETSSDAAPLFVSRSRLVRALIELVLAGRACLSRDAAIVVRVFRDQESTHDPCVCIAVEGRAGDAAPPALAELPFASDLASREDGAVRVRSLPCARAQLALVLPLDVDDAALHAAR